LGAAQRAPRGVGRDALAALRTKAGMHESKDAAARSTPAKPSLSLCEEPAGRRLASDRSRTRPDRRSSARGRRDGHARALHLASGLDPVHSGHADVHQHERFAITGALFGWGPPDADASRVSQTLASRDAWSIRHEGRDTATDQRWRAHAGRAARYVITGSIGVPRRSRPGRDRLWVAGRIQSVPRWHRRHATV
jgi:hypothetical protein